jgi:outer membrane protein assembly factor BamB
MKKVLLVCLGCLFSGAATANDREQDWPQWRGPAGTGVAEAAVPPTTWSESENIKWKIAVPGVGSSTPIVLGDRVYVSTAVKTDRVKEGAQVADGEAGREATAPARPSDRGDQGRGNRGGRPGGGRRGGFGGGPSPTNFYDFMVIAYDRGNGQEVWRSILTSQVPHEAGHNTNTFASSSPVTDGTRLYVSFGSRGVYALDLNGEKLWEKDLGQMQTRSQFGEGSSPALFGETLVVPFDHEGESFIVALDAKSGDELWRQSRDEQTTWSTPLITEYKGRTQVITNGSNRVRSYDLATGQLIWECGGQAGNPIPTPVRFKDNVIVMTGYRGYAIYSIPLDSSGDISNTDAIAWVEDDAAPYVPSPVLYKGHLYFVKANNGILVSRDAETGELIIDQTRLPDISTVYASPVAAADHIYLTGREGNTVVIKHGKTMETIASNKLDDEIDASAAIVGDQIFFRGKQYLYCIGK